MTVKGIDAQLIPNLCSRDLLMVEVETSENDGIRTGLIVSLAYFPHEEKGSMPPEPVI